jgi:broad specificity phosphatase PhoE
VRALETAQIIAAVIGYPLGQIQTDKLFMERGLGKLSGQPFSTFPDPGIYTDIEPETNVIARAQAALEILRNIEADCILVVSHGTFLLTLQKLIDPSTPDEELPNAEIVELAL